MTTKELLDIVKERGLSVVLREGKPLLVRPTTCDRVSDKLLKVLGIHRERIIGLLQKEDRSN